MTFLIFTGCLLVTFLFSLGLTSLVKKYAVKNAVIDIPNERSSHTQPTPRGGGIAVSIPIMISIVGLYLFHLISFPIFIGMLISSLIITIVGWLDDHKHIIFYWRVIFYSIASIWMISWVGSLDAISIGLIRIPLPYILGYIVTFFGLLWLTNLYNFMDGTDGLAALQGICAGLFGGVLMLVEGETGLAIVCFIIVSSCLGFLYWNWPPAKIFMGDIGSCLLGFIFGSLALISDVTGTVSVSIWCILLSVFICDATFTLLKRIICREKWYDAHCSHAYQRLVQMGITHKQLAVAFFILNTILIWPMSYAAYTMPFHAVYISIGIIVLMLMLWLLVQIRYHDYIKNGQVL
jgi:glycosyltransferase WbpL